MPLLLMLAALAIPPAIALKAWPQSPLLLRVPLLLAIAVTALPFWRRRHVVDDGALAAALGGCGAGILLLASYRLLLCTGLTSSSALPLWLLAITAPAFILPAGRYLGGGLQFLALALLADPGMGLLLPHRFRQIFDPFSLLVHQIAAGLFLAAAVGFVCLRPGLPRAALAGGLASGMAASVYALTRDRWSGCVAMGAALLALAGGLELGRRTLLHSPRVRGQRLALALAPAAALAVLVRMAIPNGPGIAPASRSEGPVRLERHDDLYDSLVLMRRGGRERGALYGSRGIFVLSPGDADVFTGAALARAYAPEARSALLVGPHFSAEWQMLASSGTYERIDEASPSLLPFGPALRIVPGASRSGRGEPRYDVVLVCAASHETCAVLPEIGRFLSPGGLLVLRRVGPRWEAPAGIADLAGSFPWRLTFWDTERSAITLCSSSPRHYDERAAWLASQNLMDRLPLIRAIGQRLEGAWLAPPEAQGSALERTRRLDLSRIYLALGAPHEANVALGIDSGRPDATELGLRSAVQLALGDPTHTGRPETLRRRAQAIDGGNPFYGAPAENDSGPASPWVLRAMGAEIPAWLLVGPFPVWRELDAEGRVGGSALARDDLFPAVPGVPVDPGPGDRVFMDAEHSREWRLVLPHGRTADDVPGQVPFDVLGKASYPGSCAYAFARLEAASPLEISITTGRHALLRIDGMAITIPGQARLPLATGSHRLLLKAFATEGEVPFATVRLQPAPRAEPHPVTISIRATKSLPDLVTFVDRSFKAWPSAAVPRGGYERLVGLEIPPIEDALSRLTMTVDGVERSLDLDDPTQVLVADDPVRHFVRVPAQDKGDVTVELRTRVSGTTFVRQVHVAQAAVPEIDVAPSAHCELSGGDEPQAQAIRDALAAIAETSDLPTEARYRFAVESGLSLEEFLRVASPAERGALALALKDGSLEPPGLMAQLDRRLITPQLQVFELDAARRLGAALSAPPHTAIFNHSGGLPTGIVDLLSSADIDLVLLGDATRDGTARMPRLFRYQGDATRPVVVVRQNEGYSFGAGMLSGGWSTTIAAMDALLSRVGESPSFPVLVQASLENRAPGALLSRRVALWNDTFAEPRLKIVTPLAYLRALPRPDSLPVWQGDLEDDALPEAVAEPRRLSQARSELGRVSPLLVLAERTVGQDATDFGTTLRRLLLRLEHSRLSQDSPDEANAGPAAIDLRLCQALARKLPGPNDYLMVLNPFPFPRHETVQTQADAADDDPELVADVPAMGYAALPVAPTNIAPVPGLDLDGESGVLRNRYYEVTFDPDRGRIVRVADREIGLLLYQSVADDDPPFLAFATASSAAGPSVAPPSGRATLQGGATWGRLSLPFSATGSAAGGVITLTLYQDVKRIDVAVRLTPGRAAGERGILLCPLELRKPALSVEGSFGERRFPTADLWPSLQVMRGGFALRSKEGNVAVASPDAPVLLPTESAILLYENPSARNGTSQRREGASDPTTFRFAITTAPAIDEAWSPYAFFRAVESPLVARRVHASGDAAAEPPLFLRKSFLQAQPETAELIARVVSPPDPRGSPLELFVRNATDRARQQKIILPDQGNYFQFPLRERGMVKLEVDPERP